MPRLERAAASPGAALLLAASLAACAPVAGSAAGSAGGTPPPDLGPTPVAPVPASGGPATAGPPRRWNLPPPSVTVDPALEPLVAAAGRAARAGGLKGLSLDGALCQVAADLARTTRAGSPSYALVEYWMRYHGRVDPIPTVVTMRASGSDPSASPSLEAAARQLEKELPQPLAKGRYTHFGIARVGPRVVLALLSRRVAVEPLPRWLPVGSGYQLNGRLLPGFKNPKVYRTSPDGKASTLPVQGGPGGFSARVACDAGPGAYTLEISGADRFGSSIVALFGLHCGEPGPYPPAPRDLGEPAVASSEVAETALLALVNRDRQKHGLGPVKPDLQLTQVARKHSDEMLRLGYVGHISPTTGAPADRVRKAGLTASTVRENLARALGPREAEQGLMDSPGHRANILAKDVTHLGIGVSLGDRVGEKRELFVTQLFARYGVPLDAVRAPVAVLADLARRRKAAGVRPLQVDAELTRLAQGYGALMARGDRHRAQAQAQLRAGLERQAARLASAQAFFVATSDVENAADTPALLDRSLTHVGVSVVPTRHPTGVIVAGVAIVVGTLR